MLVADTLRADLSFYANAHVTTQGWPAMQELRGVAEGDMTRYALERREPLAVELEEFCALLRGEDGAAVVTLEEGLETVAVAEAVLASASVARRERARGPSRRHDASPGSADAAVVVALGKVGLPLAARIALAGHEVVGADVDPRVVALVNAGKAPFPNEAGLAGGAGGHRRRRAPARSGATPRPRSPRARTWSSPSPRWWSTRAPARTGRSSMRSSPTSAGG